ncbi:hypothetical protein ACFXAZ_19290 [Streptomyces sp. NPDC059477]|uniref:hypothetical protein n=1 Tax=Streptomyces sp. NPDC059477 TaxID=3346847 RepID=UPI0036BB9403
MAVADDEGYTYTVDRVKGMFIAGGENVCPAEVENVLYSHRRRPAAQRGWEDSQVRAPRSPYPTEGGPYGP